MKKLLCVALALCFMLSLLAACGGDSETASTTDKTPSSNNSSTGGDTATTVDIADFEGTWKYEEGNIAYININATDKVATTYAANGVVIGTFPVVATAIGIELKMGDIGSVTLTDPTALTITTVPAVSTIDVTGEYEMIYGEYVGATLNVKDEKNWDLSNCEKPDTGTYSIQNGEAYLNPTKELGGTVYHRILAGGKVLEAYSPSSRIYIEKEFANTNEGKAFKNYYSLIFNKWAANDDENYTVEFAATGKVSISGVEMGIWYPTATGATAVFTDGSEEKVEFTADGINFYYKSFVIVK